MGFVAMIGFFITGNAYGDYGATFYDHADFQGDSGTFGDSIPYVGDRLNDKTSSLKVASGYTLIAYRDKNYEGEKREYKGQINWIGQDFNDCISSIKLLRNGYMYEPRPRAGDIILGGKQYSTGHVGILAGIEAWESHSQKILLPFEIFPIYIWGDAVDYPPSCGDVQESNPFDFRWENMLDGVQNHPLDHFIDGRDYTTVSLFRVYTDDDTARKAAEKSLEYAGKYNLFDTRWDGKTWYCSQLVYKAYLEGAGINLDPSVEVITHKFLGLESKGIKGRSAPCNFISPCDIAKSGQVYLLKEYKNGGKFNCDLHKAGC